MGLRSATRALLTPLRTATTARYLRRLLRAQEAQAAATTQQNRILDALGQVLARASNQQWMVHLPPEDAPLDPLALEEDAAGVFYPDDATAAAIETIQEDYLARFDRDLSDEDARAIHTEHLQAAGTVQ